MIPPKKILLVCNTDFYLTRFLSPLVCSLADRGFEIHIATEGKDIPISLQERCVGIHQIHFPKKASLSDFSESVRQLRQIIRSTKFDCVNGHNRNASIVARVAAWREKIPINLYTAHGFYFHDDQSTLARIATIGLEGILARITNFTLSQSAEDAALMIRLRLISKKKIKVIDNGINHRKFSLSTDRATLERRLGLASGVFRMVGIGRIVEGKGFADTIRAFSQFLRNNPARVNSELVIVGGNIASDISPAADTVRNLLKEYGIENKVQITGLVDNVEEYLGCADIFISSSYREGMPRVLLEAMCVGLPVIVTNIRGSREIVTDEQQGFLYPPHDVAKCTDVMEKLYDNVATRERMAKQNRELVLERYTEDAYTDRQVSAIAELISQIQS